MIMSTNGSGTSVEVDEDVLRELYLSPFEMLVKDAECGDYERLQPGGGVYATEYRYTLTDILRAGGGFDGYVQSDFWSCRSSCPVTECRHGSRNAGRQVAQRGECQGCPLRHEPGDSKPSTVHWFAATPKCSDSHNSSARTIPARSTARRTAPSAEASPWDSHC